MRLRTALPTLLALTGLVAPVLPVAPAQAAPARRIVVSAFDTGEELSAGRFAGVAVNKGRLVLSEPRRSGDLEIGRWSSPWTAPGFDLTELVASWEARTPGSSWMKLEVQGRTAAGTVSSWDTLTHWALRDEKFRRTSLDSQPDDLGRVAYDTWLTSGVASYRLRVSLVRRAGETDKPTVGMLRVMASRLPSATSVATSTPGAVPEALGTVLPVPRYSQMTHKDTYTQYDGGGEAWCSPTSTAMVLAYYDKLPAPSAYAWVRADTPDRVVPHLARMTYDVGFGGTGNWPFNTAYAASRTGDAFVTRLRSLREAERFIAAGIPLIVSVTFSGKELAGAPLTSTSGHVLVVVGFTEDGDVVVNDPAAPAKSSVRRTYDRDQFEDVWLRRYASGSTMKGSGGLVYVIRDSAHPLPARNGNRNW